MINLSTDQRNRLIATVLGTLAAVIGLFFLAITPLNASWDRLSVEKENVEKQNRKDRLLLKEADSIVNALSEKKSELEAIEGTMATDPYFWMIKTMNGFKEGYKVNIPQYSPANTNDIGILPYFPYQAAIFKISGTALFSDLGKFIADFENRFPYYRLQNLELEPAKEGMKDAASAEEMEMLSFSMEVVVPVANTKK